MSAPLFTPERITSDITTNIAKVHTESTATVTRRAVTISRYLNGFLIAMYLSTVINTRWVKVANLSHIKDNVLSLSKVLQNVPFFNIRCTSVAIRIGCPSSPVKRSAPARHARRIVALFRKRFLVTTANITRAFNSTVGKTEMELMLIIATRWL